VRIHIAQHVVGVCFCYFFAYLRNMASKRVRDDSEIVFIWMLAMKIHQIFVLVIVIAK
jgi:hypothetical protein